MSALDRHFSGFISYNHQDSSRPGQDWAAWAQGILQSYKTPDELVGQTSIYGDPVPPSMPHIFRDKTQLPGTGDLDSMLKEALTRSRVLIVLCTPAAARSPWVNQEVRFFKQLGRSKQIVALVLQGRPHSGDATTECYPPSLAYELDESGNPDPSRLAHPIFIDLRSEDAPAGATAPEAYREILTGTGKLRDDYIEVAVNAYAARLENARIMLLSGALGLYTPELTQREVLRQIEERKQRDLELAERLATARRRTRMATLTSSVFALLLAAAVFAAFQALRATKEARTSEILAIDAQKQAEKSAAELRQSEAELAQLANATFDLVGWDSGVSPERAEPVLRDIVGFHRRHSSGKGDPLSLAYYGSALNCLGDICFGSNQIPDSQLDKEALARRQEAFACYEEALDAYRRCLAAEPENSAHLVNLSSTLHRIGNSQTLSAEGMQGELQLKELERALQNYVEATSYAERLVAIFSQPGADPQTAITRLDEVASGHRNQGVVHEEVATHRANDSIALKSDLVNAAEAYKRALGHVETIVDLASKSGLTERALLSQDWVATMRDHIATLQARIDAL